MNEIKNYSEAIGLIKSAILKSRYRAAALANRELLSLYYGIGRFISENSRSGFWGTGAIDAISENLQQEMPGLRGFSAANIKKMRLFFEQWYEHIENRTSATYDLETTILEEGTNRALVTHDLKTANNVNFTNRSLTMNDFKEFSNINSHYTDEEEVINRSLLMNDFEEYNSDFPIQLFLQVGFTHHCEVMYRAKSLEERLFYIERCATEFWSVENLKYHLKSDLYGKRGTMPNNFKTTITDKEFQRKALLSFKDEYLVDFINIEAPDDEPDERVFESEIVSNIRKFIMALAA